MDCSHFGTDDEIANIVWMITHPANYAVVFGNGHLDVGRRPDGRFEVAMSCDPHEPKVMVFKDPVKAARRFVTWRAKLELVR